MSTFTGPLKVKRGVDSSLPTLAVGEFGFTTDTHEVYIGSSAGNILNGPSSGSGTVTQVNSGTGLTGGPITTTGTLSIDATGVSAGTYGNSSQSARITVNAQGQITSVSEVTITVGVYNDGNGIDVNNLADTINLQFDNLSADSSPAGGDLFAFNDV